MHRESLERRENGSGATSKLSYNLSTNLKIEVIKKDLNDTHNQQPREITTDKDVITLGCIYIYKQVLICRA